MANLNKWTGIGFLGQDPIIKQTKDGKDIATISVGVTESWKDKEGQKQSRTEWVRVTIFGGSATFTKNYIKKGSLVYVEGQLQTRKYTDKDGVEKYSTEIVVQNLKGQIQNLSSKKEDGKEKARNEAWAQVEEGLPNDLDDSESCPF